MIKRFFFLFSLFLIIFPISAFAEWGIVDSLNLAPYVPMVLNALMTVAQRTYAYFVGTLDSPGIIYIMTWCFVAIYIAMYLLKMYLPANWGQFFGMNDTGSMWDGKVKPFQMGTNLLKPGIRAIIAVSLLLPIQPRMFSDILINPFLEFGAYYTHGIQEAAAAVSPFGMPEHLEECPVEITTGDDGFITKKSCDFIIQPISIVAHANNQIVKRGLNMLMNGIHNLMGLIPRGNGGSFVNIITGLILASTFVSCNFFLALLIIQGVFDFGMSLVLYPFKVLQYVMQNKNDSWLDLWAPFGQIVTALKKLVVAMIASMFILIVNVAVVAALFNWNSSVFVAAAGGMATSNLPSGGGSGFGAQSMVWLSAIITLLLFKKIFDMSKKKILEYTEDGSDKLYKEAAQDYKDKKKWTQDTAKTGKKIVWDKWILGKDWKDIA
ncbi:MAG: hypothetical protein LBO08_01050 [Rickettsiales bacterium]|jgi:hypothetical protein|nr:hypothetical protein [Rickettsiales bacterium]